MKRKTLSLLLSISLIAIVFAAMPLSASAAETFIIPSTSSSVRMNGNTTVSSSTKMNAISWNYRHYPANNLNLGAGTYYIRLYNSNGYLPTSVSGSDVNSGNYVIYSNSGQISSSNTTCNYISTDSSKYYAYFEIKLTKTITDLEIYCQNNSTLGQNDVYLTVTKANYTVTLNNQSATYAGSTSATATYGSSMPSITVPTRTGYTFGGYYTSTNGGGTQYYTASGISAKTYTLASNTTLYAKWTPYSYTVSYSANGGSGAPASQTKYYDTNLALSTTVPTRTGYTFKGWSTSSTATSATYSAESTYTSNAGATLYAVWAINTSTLNINPNGGTWNEYTASISFTQNYNTTKSVPLPTRTGYNFTGWTRTNNYGSITSTTATATYTYGATNDVTDTLTANWSAKTYTVTLNNQSATTAGSTSTTATYNSAMPNITVPTKTGYTFNGYYTSTNGGGTKYYNANGTGAKTSALTSATTLYAYWTAKSYTISTAVNNADYGSVSGSGAGDYNTTKTLTATPNTGYKFTGWTDGNTTNPRTVTITGNATYTANFAAESKTITVSANPSDGGSVSGGGTIDYGTTVNLSATANTGYKFAGWYNDTTKVSDNNTYSFTATESIALAAKFELNTYEVSLVKGSGTINSGNITAYTYGIGATLPTASDLSYGSLSFAGWYEDVEFSGSPVTEISATEMGNKTYYAKWTASGVTNGSFVSFADSGYYSPSADAEDEEKEGIIAFSTEFAQIGQYGNQVTDFGIWIYKAGATDGEKVKLCKTDDASLTELKANGGKFYATVEEITLDYINNQAFAVPYIVIGGQVYFGNPITGSVNLSKWLGEKTAE